MPRSTTKAEPKPVEQVPVRIRIQSDDGGGIQLEAALPIEDDKPPLRRFAMTAYTGGAMQLSGWRPNHGRPATLPVPCRWPGFARGIR